MNTVRDRLGQHGADVVTTTAAMTVAAGNTWFAIQAIWSVVVFATLTELGPISLTGTTASTALTSGSVIYGAFTNFTLTTGAVRCYRAKATSG